MSCFIEPLHINQEARKGIENNFQLFLHEEKIIY